MTISGSFNGLKTGKALTKREGYEMDTEEWEVFLKLEGDGGKKGVNKEEQLMN